MENTQITQYVAPVATIEEAGTRYEEFQRFVKGQLKKDIDFGVIPGVDKPTLLKPGAEKLATFFGLRSVLSERESVKDWTGKDHNGEPFFYFEYTCDLYRGEQIVASSVASCNSMEKKYRYRNVQEEDVPSNLDKNNLRKVGGKRTEFKFAIDKAETSGQYGKPQSYWDEWNRAISDGRAKLIDKATKTGKLLPAYEMDATSYQIPNPDIPDLVNTIQKMAQKRAIVGSVLIATNASGFFTQDVEDMDIPITNGRQHRGHIVSDEGEIMDGEFTSVSVPEPEPAPEFVPELVLTSDGTPYDELPTDKLSARFNAMQKKLKDNGLTDEQKAEYEKKIKEAQRILAKRRSYADSGN
jgi:hypothetical protein